ncbi:CDP-glycerol glycerophosphotransferase family protein [Thiomicrospira microaerophila]|uniref:CDP-glycerol glycerophosphotransferase family protein n=1 Tax=Thiomicrospira microaerophila TaxID=406020 RepID=UPI00200ED203|nr:CDP-glycerol glycerophosphotransferase family protein [Thiomicrospira microaerophila]UQB42432.1 CDP-glycerol glycerophosphotransferase family protein [Thiomicrospira microaerophila]
MLREKMMSIRKYVFFVNAAYCYAIFRPLQEVILLKGGEVAWFFSPEVHPQLNPNEVILSTSQQAMAYAPDVVFTAGDWVPYYLPGIKVQVFHGIARNKRGAETEQESDHYRIRGWFDLYCTHADADTLEFRRLARHYQTFTVAKTGWSKLDSLFKQNQLQKADSENELPTVFFASTFSPSITAAPSLFQFIERIVKSGRWRVLVTLHPKMNQDVVDKYRSIVSDHYWYFSPEDDLYLPMQQADIMLCDTSSIMYEFMFLNKPVVTFKTRNPGPHLTDFDDPQQLESVLLSTLKNNQQLIHAAKLCDELHGFRDGLSSQRIVEAIEECFDLQKFENLKPKPFNFIRKLKIRHKMNYWSL